MVVILFSKGFKSNLHHRSLPLCRTAVKHPPHTCMEAMNAVATMSYRKIKASLVSGGGCGADTGLKAEYVNAVHDAVRLEVVCRMRASGDFGFRDPAVSRLSAVRDWLTCRVEPWLLKLGSLLLAAMSFMVIWSEATIGSGTHPDLSPFSKAS